MKATDKLTKGEQQVLRDMEDGHSVTWDGYAMRWRQRGRVVKRAVMESLIARGFLYTHFPRGGGYAGLDKPAREWLAQNPATAGE